MKTMNTSRTFLALAALALAGGTVTAHAQDMNAVRQRMEQRLSSLDALKDKGLVGENNRGYLEARGALSPADSSAVAAENADRGIVYAAIARQTGSNSDQVGRARAQKLAEMSKAGVWVQRATGEWARK
ncbi:MAG: YdbL family protein [Opitutaceae bacterium]|nr:YdbL family protein [Opitutaceae bacterium]MBP8963280.1 YdbL family protein [Opitutaceae bacterium]